MHDILDVSIIDIEKTLFLLNGFDFITVKDGKKHHKQEQALIYLTDNETTELGYGGAAGGAKSWTGCTWLAFMCECYPGTKWFIGRKELKRLKESTLITFYKVCREYKIVKWHFNGQDNAMLFDNGSMINLLDLVYLPGDPLYERYGSIEYTGGWIEEAGEINFGAYDILKSRIGRHLNDKYGLLRKLFCTFNPKKNFVDSYFYRPWKEEKLPSERKFIRALVDDNPHGETDYKKTLESLTSEVSRQRLLHGNFDYDDDPAALCDYDAICDMFTCEKPLSGNQAISADLAMKGRDSFIVGYWQGLKCLIEIDKPKATGKSIENDLRDTMKKYGVGHSQTVVDSDGMGSYLESYLTGIKEFHAGATANNNREFANLKSECGYKLAEVINKRQIKIVCSFDQQEVIKQQIAVLKEADIAAIYNYDPKPGTSEERAKNYWLFMYFCNGMNVKDMCLLKWKNIDQDFIEFDRAKTIRTKRVIEKIRVPLLDDAKAIISKHSNKAINKEAYVFPVLGHGLSATRQRDLVQLLTKLINENMKRIAAAVGIKTNLTTYVARHTFSTVLKRSGASVEFISEALGHSNLKTTQNYLASFEDDKKKEVARALTAFKTAG